MLKNWTSHAEYQQFIVLKLSSLYEIYHKKITTFYCNGRSFSRRSERLLQKIFTLVAVKPSFDLNLIHKENLTIAGDGTCVHCYSKAPEGIEYRQLGTMEHNICDIPAQRMKGRKMSWSINCADNLSKILSEKFSNRLFSTVDNNKLEF